MDAAESRPAVAVGANKGVSEARPHDEYRAIEMAGLRPVLTCRWCKARAAGVIDSRAKDTRTGVPLTGVRRRRVCKGCDRRWTTYEVRQEDLARLLVDRTMLERMLSNLPARSVCVYAEDGQKLLEVDLVIDLPQGKGEG